MIRLWTTTVHYSATYEGETFIAWIEYAENAEQSKAELVNVSLTFHRAFAKSSQGLVRNAVTQLLFSEKALKRIEVLNRRPTVEP